jgi:GNAT superfamily N-acetyltransferase
MASDETTRGGSPRPSVSVRVACPDDSVLLAELGARTFYDAFAQDNDPDDMTAYMVEAFGAEVQAAELAEPDTTFLIAEFEGIPVGYARLRRNPVPATIPGARPIEIARLYAEQEWIGRGVGRALMESALELGSAQGCDTIWLSTWDRNERGLAFYRRWGFEVVGEGEFLVGSDVQRDLLVARMIESE